MNLAQSIKEYICSSFDVEADELELDTELFSSGILDSFSMVSLVHFIEKTASVKFGAFDLNMSNLDSIEAILRFVDSKS
jgi:acyl carrier protein